MSITTALEARRDALREREAGFTLIELLVVVIIIGILAAIAIPIYIGVQNNAKDKAAQSDLTNARTAIVAFYSDTSGFPTNAQLTAGNTGDLNKYGFPAASGSNASAAVANATSGTATITAFCLRAKSDSGSWFYLSQAGTPTTASTGCVAGS